MKSNQSDTKKKVYEVRLNTKIMWIAADSKKAIVDFFNNPKPKSVILRPDCNPDLSMFVL